MVFEGPPRAGGATGARTGGSPAATTAGDGGATGGSGYHGAGLRMMARYPRLFSLGFAVSVLIAIGVVVRRLYALGHPGAGGPPQLVALDRAFSTHAGLTVAHILPAAGFVGLAALYVFGGRGKDWLYPLGAVVGTTAYLMSGYAVGGWVERSAVLLFDTWFLAALGVALWFRMRDGLQERRWLIRAIGVLFGIATTRPVMGVFFATSRLTHWGPQQFFGWAFWIGFTINVIVTELLLKQRTPAEARAFVGKV